MINHSKSPARSKKGIALATVIVVSCVIVILATSLIGVAISSIESTSGNVDERQAYLNAKSALDYSAEYYDKSAALPEVSPGASTGEEYILFKEQGETPDFNAAQVANIGTDTSPYNTYVHSEYDQTNSTLTLTAYAMSSDAFGKKKMATTLAVTYTVGTSGGPVSRHHPTTIYKPPRTRSNDDVTIHVRRDPNAIGTDNYFDPAIYTWSYLLKKNGGFDYTDNIDYWEDANKTITKHSVNFNTDFTVNEMNTIESAANEIEPAGTWNAPDKNGANFRGPSTKMDQSVNSTDWFEHTFSPTKMAEAVGGSGARMVPWFSMIVSRQGPGLVDKGDGTQSCEFLNVWYLDSSDRNIYVEILQSPLYYYMSSDWNGKTNLEGRLIAYCNAPQTVYFVKTKGVNDKSVQPTLSGRSMTYCGYGWWIYRDGKGTLDTSGSLNVGANGAAYTLSDIRSGSDNSITKRSSYIVIDPANSTARSFSGEEAAAIYTGAQDYVTVYAKAYKNNSLSHPKISYLVETHSDSAAKRKLKAAIGVADQLYKGDYTDESWNKFLGVLNAAKEVYNNPVLQSDEIYDAETEKIQDAMAALTSRPVDTTKLEQLIAEAASKPEAEYTSESYAPMVTVSRQAQDMVDAAKENSGAITQNEIEAKCAELRSKIDSLDPIQPYRDRLNALLTEAENTKLANEGSPAIPELQAAIDEADALKSSNSKTAIEEAIKKLALAVNKVKNIGDTSQLLEAIEKANDIIENEGSSVAEGSLENLRDVVSAAEAALSSVLTQDEVDKYLAALNDAMGKLIYVPKDKNAPEKGKKRVWFDLSALGNSSGYYMYAWFSNGGPGQQNTAFLNAGEWSKYPELKLTHDASTGYYYYDLEEKYTNMIVVRNSDNVQTHDLNYDKNKNFIIINGNNSASAPTYAHMATVFVEKKSPWGSAAQYAYVSSSGTTSLNTKTLTSNKLTVSDGSGKYFVAHIAFDDRSKFYIHNGNKTGSNRTVDIKLQPTDFMVLYPDKNLGGSANVAVNADTWEKIRLSKPVTNIKAVSKVSPSHMSYKGGAADIEKLAAGVFVDTAVPASPTITVYFKKPDSWSKRLKATVCQLDGSGNVISNTEQGNLGLITSDEKYYSISLDADRVNAVTITDGSSSSRKTPRLKLATNASGKYYNAQIISEKTGGGFEIKMYTSPQASVSPVDVTFSDNNLDMAFIGGKKQVFENVQDTRPGRKDMSGNGIFKFNGGSIADGYARVGLTKTSTYYDWYAYKIPASEDDLYTFAVKGLNSSSSSTETKQIHQVWGDVWVTLTANAEMNGSKYKALISTVNPEDNITQENTTVYFTQNTDLISNHGGMKVTMWGTESKVVTLSDTYDGYYRLDVPQNMPFLQLSSVDDTVVYEKTKLQGGDKILYDYSAGAGGSPVWLTYVPPKIAIQRERASAEAVGRGWVIYDYNYNTHASNRVYQAKYLENLANKDNPENRYDDNNPSRHRARANLLAEWTIAYKNLYNAISSGRSYLTSDGRGNPKWYPESADDTSGSSYTSASIAALYDAVKAALTEYESSSPSLQRLKDCVNDIQERINELEPDNSSKAVLILDDYAGWGTTGIVIEYKDTFGVTQQVPVTSQNTRGEPTIYIDAPITNVRFGNGHEWGSYQSEIAAGEEWVYNNCPDPTLGLGGWTRNNQENYFIITGEQYTQHGTEDRIVGDAATEENFTLYFEHDLSITYKPTAGAAERTYLIPAGAYHINLPDYQTYYAGSGLPPDKINLYSMTAEKYFTNLKNEGMSDIGVESDTLGWTNSGNIKNHVGPYTHSGDVNFIAMSGSLNGTYTINGGGCYFRWEGATDCTVEDGTVIEAESFTIASPEKISAASGYGPSFILQSSDPAATTTTITFLTNTIISYRDTSGDLVEYTIYEGTYEFVDPLAQINLFDKSSWDTGIRQAGSGGGTGAFLSDPRYSTE